MPPYRVANIEDPFPPHLRFFETPERRVFLTEIPVYTFLSIDVSPEDVRGGARVLARYNDAQLSPFFIVKDFGRGHVGVITTSVDLSPDQRWSRIADQPRTLLPLLFDGLHALSAGARENRNVQINHPLRAEARGFPRNVSVTDPGAHNEKIAVDEKKKTSGDRYPLEYIKTEKPGLYQFDIETAGGVGAVTSTSLKFAVGLDASEGDLSRASAESVGVTLPGLDVRVGGSIDPEAPVNPQNNKNNELWPVLIGSALGILILEALLATWFGRRRS